MSMSAMPSMMSMPSMSPMPSMMDMSGMSSMDMSSMMDMSMSAMPSMMSMPSMSPMSSMMSMSGMDMSSMMEMSSMSGMCMSLDTYLNIISVCPQCLMHGILMFISYYVLMLFGIFVSRYLRLYVDWWFPVHIGFMSFSVLLAVVSIIVANLMPGVDAVTPSMGGPSMSTMNVHHILGYITFSLQIVQILLGATSHFRYKKNRIIVPWVPDRLHWYTGWVTLLCAAVTIYTAIWLMMLPDGYYWLWSMYLVLVLMGIAAMELIVRKLFPPRALRPIGAVQVGSTPLGPTPEGSKDEIGLEI